MRRGPAGQGALVLLVLSFVSPLCALSSALFSARVLHHLVLVAGVAPLLALALRGRGAEPPPGDLRADLHTDGLARGFALHAVVLWAWHAPPLYAWGLASVPGYWLMQATLLASALLFWRAVLAPGANPAAAVAALIGTVAHMGLLGALLVFAPGPLFAVHLATTWPWGLSPLEDQQLAGLTMWVLSAGPYLGAGLALAWRRLAPAAP